MNGALMALLLMEQQTRRRNHRRRGKGNVRVMNELVKQYQGKCCVLSVGSLEGKLEGTIETVEENWAYVRTRRGIELINLDYIWSIREKNAGK